MEFRAAIAEVLALALIVAAPAESWGDPTSSERAYAQELFARGEGFYNAGNYDAAIASYRAAYAIVPLPGLIFNIAQAHRMNAEYAEALRDYERFLVLAPAHRLARSARARVAEVERLLADRAQVALPEPIVVGPPAPPPAPARPARKPPPPSGRRALNVAAWLSTGTGAVALALAGKYALDARAAERAVSAHVEGPWTDELVQRDRSGRAAERAMTVALISGCAVLATGGALFWLGSRESGVEVAPALFSDRAGGASLRGAF